MILFDCGCITSQPQRQVHSLALQASRCHLPWESDCPGKNCLNNYKQKRLLKSINILSHVSTNSIGTSSSSSAAAAAATIASLCYSFERNYLQSRCLINGIIECLFSFRFVSYLFPSRYIFFNVSLSHFPEGEFVAHVCRCVFSLEMLQFHVHVSYTPLCSSEEKKLN